MDCPAWDVTFDLSIRGTYTLFVCAPDEVTAAAKAALEANKYLAYGYYIELVTVKKRD